MRLLQRLSEVEPPGNSGNSNLYDVFFTLVNKSTPKLIPSCILGRDGFVDKNDENNQNF